MCTNCFSRQVHQFSSLGLQQNDDNGPDMFAKLEEVIKEYNECNLSSGGKAKLQIYERCDVFYDLSQDTPPQRKEKSSFLNQ